MALQTTYGNSFAKGFPGMIANGETSNRISRIVEDAAGIAFGKPVFRGTADIGIVAAPVAANLLGFTIANYAAPPVQATGVQADIYPDESTAAVLTMGVMWVTVGGDVTDGAQAYVGDGAPLAIGVLTAASTDNVILNGWFFQDTVSSGGLARIAKR